MLDITKIRVHYWTEAETLKERLVPYDTVTMDKRFLDDINYLMSEMGCMTPNALIAKAVSNLRVDWDNYPGGVTND